MKRKTSFALSAETADLLAKVAEKTGASKSAAMAAAVWAYAERLGLVRPASEEARVKH